jgi:hypothetical protein
MSGEIEPGPWFQPIGQWIGDNIDLGDAVGLSALMISVGALIYSRVSAKAARGSEKAAHESVAEMRAARKYEERPQFDIKIGRVGDGGVCIVTVTMLDGPPVIRVTAVLAAHIRYLTNNGTGPEPATVTPEPEGPFEMAKGVSKTFSIPSCSGAAAVEVKIVLASREDGEGDREWTSSEQVKWANQARAEGPR